MSSSAEEANAAHVTHPAYAALQGKVTWWCYHPLYGHYRMGSHKGLYVFYPGPGYTFNTDEQVAASSAVPGPFLAPSTASQNNRKRKEGSKSGVRRARRATEE